MKRNFVFEKGFTLAEVLIALAIIGIVASLTIPNIIKNYQERQTITKVKKFYSDLDKAIKLAIVKNGTVNNWNYGGGSSYNSTSNEKFWSYLKPHLAILKDNCSITNDCYYNGKIKLLNNVEGNNYTQSTWWRTSILKDGSVMWFRTNGEYCKYADGAGESNVCANVWYDVNGKKEPNKIAKEMSEF